MGKYPIMKKKSLRVLSVTMEGTQLHVYTIFGGIVEENLKERKMVGSRLIGEITL